MKTKVFRRSGYVLNYRFIDVKQITEVERMRVEMKKQGFVESLDEPVDCVVDYDTGQYEFTMTGVYVGDKAWRHEGYLTNYGLVRHTPKSK